MSRENLHNIDLNVDNYSYNDLLNLFRLTYNFSGYELKQAKKIVLMTHPDKCGYDKEVFLFFSKAYKLLYSVYTITNNKTKNITYTSYNPTTEEHEKDMKEFYKKFAESKDFNKRFNELFDRIKLTEDDDGYNDWLKEEQEESTTVTNIDSMNIEIEKRKENLKSIIKTEDLNDVGLGHTNMVASMLDKSRPSYYESNVFDKLKYDDLKRAYTETVVPVTKQDYLSREKFSSIDSYKRHRENIINSENNDYLNHINHIKIQEQQKISDEMRAYNMVRQDEKTQEILNKWNRHFLRIKN
jgi:hypothetical protein